jgi:hypothetical protein
MPIYRKTNVEKQIKTLEDLFISEAKRKKEPGLATAQIRKINSKILATQKRITKLQYILKRMGDNESIEIPTSAIPK